MEEIKEDIVKDDAANVETFITNTEAGISESDKSRANQEAVKQFLINKRLQYADAAHRASMIQSNSAEYAVHVQTMNDVKASIGNLASQKNAMLKAQADYISDFENGLVSNGNSFSGKNHANAFTGKLAIEIDDAGNILFDNNGRKEGMSAYANYGLKDYKTAQDILDINSKVYSAGKQMSEPYKAMIGASVKEKLAKGGRNTLMSLWTDGLIPGLNYKDISKDLFKPEKTQELFDLTVSKLTQGIYGAGNQGYAEKQQKAKVKAASKAKATSADNTTDDETIYQLQKSQLDFVNANLPSVGSASEYKGAMETYLPWPSDKSGFPSKVRIERTDNGMFKIYNTDRGDLLPPQTLTKDQLLKLSMQLKNK